jgi:hypothetical protein
MANLSIVNSTSELAGRSKKVKKTYSRHRKVHGPGKTNKEILEKDHEEGMGDEDKENEDDEMEGSGADDNEEEVEKSSGILSGGDQRDNDRERNRSSPELGKHRDEEQAMEETDTVAAADKSEDEVEEDQGEALPATLLLQKPPLLPTEPALPPPKPPTYPSTNSFLLHSPN